MNIPALQRNGKCKRCGCRMTWADQRRQFARLIQNKGMSPDQAGGMMPLCQKCVTAVIRGQQ